MIPFLKSYDTISSFHLILNPYKQARIEIHHPADAFNNNSNVPKFEITIHFSEHNRW